MDFTELKDSLDSIQKDDSLATEEKVGAMLGVRDDRSEADPDNKLNIYEAVYQAILELLTAENAENEHDHDIIMVLTMLAETYSARYDYRPMKDIAHAVLDFMREEDLPFEAYKDTIPRLIDAIEYSVYRHAQLEILLYFFRAAVEEGVDLSEYEEEAEKMIRLYIVLEKDHYLEELFDHELEKALSGIFSSEQLISMIKRPERNRLKCDPVEYTWQWEQIADDVDDEVDRRLKDVNRGMGFCFMFWEQKRKLLKEKYGIDWKSPGVMNPRVHFD